VCELPRRPEDAPSDRHWGISVVP
jgi:hypothetical protein